MIRKFARPMLASVYIADGVDTLTNTDAHVEATESVLKKVRALLPPQYARQIPNDPELVARAVGGTKVGAGSLLALGKAPRLSAGVLALTAVPTILGRHAFWETQDPQEKSARRSGFLTSVALLGGLGITTMDTQGKPGLRWRASHAAQDATKAVQKALPTQSQTESALDNASSWISDRADDAQKAYKQASSQVADYVDDNKDDWKKTAAAAATTAGAWIDQARDQGKSVAKDVQKKAPKWADQAQGFFQDAQKDGRKWLDDVQDDAKTARKRVVKAADKAQSRAEDALDKAETRTGRARKRAAKKADKLQSKADKRIKRAVKKLDK